MLLRKRIKRELDEEVYYHCRDMQEGRKGIVKHIIQHHYLTYYVLEVETGIDPVLTMKSEFQINSENVYD